MNSSRTLTALLGGTLLVATLAIAQGRPPGPPPQQPPPKRDTVLIQTWVDRLTKAIEGKEETPASEVFQNVKTFPKMPSGRFLGMMRNWTRILGVDCEHCHVVGQWAVDDKPPKLTARAMETMEDDVNALIKKISSIKNERARVNCWTCHRGSPTPETNPAGFGRRDGPPRGAGQ
jgi:hypothetical protein